MEDSFWLYVDFDSGALNEFLSLQRGMRWGEGRVLDFNIGERELCIVFLLCQKSILKRISQKLCAGVVAVAKPSLINCINRAIKL